MAFCTTSVDIHSILFIPLLSAEVFVAAINNGFTDSKEAQSSSTFGNKLL